MLVITILVVVVVILQTQAISFKKAHLSRDSSLLSLSMSSIEDAVTGSPTVLKAEGISKSWVGSPQFEDISIGLRKGQRTGLIGVNGAGKTTLLRCLSGLDEPDSGTIESERACNVVYVDQEPDWPAELLAFEALFADAGTRGTSQQVTDMARAVREYMMAQTPEAERMESYIDMLTKATDLMEEHDAWTYMDSGLSIVKRLNVDMLYRKVSTMSGGERKRLGLAAALVRKPDVLLLDEPTNHLDVDALEWLAAFLGSTEGGGGSQAAAADKSMSVLLVTHDRHFLEQVCNEIIELDRASVHAYPGNYGRYLELKDERLRAEDADQDRAKTRLRKEREWMSKQPKARQAKSKARQEQFYALVDKATDKSKGSAGAGAGAVKLATKEEADKQQRLGGVVIDVRNARFILDAAGDTAEGEEEAMTLLDSFSYSFRQRDRIAIVGPNGVGKSTFLKLLTGNLPLLEGTIRLGETVRLGYYEQMGLRLTDAEKKEPVLRFVQAAVEKGVSRNVNTLAENERYDAGGAASEAGGLSNKNSNAGKIVVSSAAPVGRRKAVAGKEGAMSIEVMDDSYGGGASSSTAVSEREAMSLLSRFNFPSSRWYDRVDKLSGGEKRRLQLLQVLATRPNVLLLDEPSNDLDLATLQVLEDYLADTFDGMLVVVSHDNFLVNKVAEHLFVFEGDGVVRDFQGSYSDYLVVRKQRQQDAAAAEIAAKKATATKAKKPSATAASTSPSPGATTSSSTTSSSTTGSGTSGSGSAGKGKKSNLTYPEQKEMMRLEKSIEKLLGLIASMEENIAAPENAKEGYTVLAKWQEEADALREQMELDEERWLELAEKDA